MENTSKALLIAAAVLIVILIITVGIKIFSVTKGIDIPAKQTGDAIEDVIGNKTGTVIEQLNGGNAGNEQNEGQGNVNKEFIEKDKPYVGYYADLNGDGTVDGIIYADLAIGITGKGSWDNCFYRINKKEVQRSYYISQKNYGGSFGTRDVITVDEESKQINDTRFYVMSLTDIDGKAYVWYDETYASGVSTNDSFGAGKTNTQNMINKWNSKNNIIQEDKYIWSRIKPQFANGWFVPSIDEWSAFGGELKITEDNYKKYGMRQYYWSSSKYSSKKVYYVYFGWGYPVYAGESQCSIYQDTINTSYYVRLSTVF